MAAAGMEVATVLAKGVEAMAAAGSEAEKAAAMVAGLEVGAAVAAVAVWVEVAKAAQPAADPPTHKRC